MYFHTWSIHDYQHLWIEDKRIAINLVANGVAPEKDLYIILNEGWAYPVLFVAILVRSLTWMSKLSCRIPN